MLQVIVAIKLHAVKHPAQGSGKRWVATVQQDMSSLKFDLSLALDRSFLAFFL